MTCAETYGYRREGSNPCKGIKRYRRRGRERFLSGQQIRRLGVVLKQHEEAFPMHVAIIRLLLLTGCRKQEIATLQWKEYRERHLHLRDSKTGPRMVWLSSPARQILEGFPRIASWIFPSPRTGNSISKSTVDHFWLRVRSDAGLRGVRLHDLRHSYASIAVMQGENVLTVGRLLGHRDVSEEPVPIRLSPTPTICMVWRQVAREADEAGMDVLQRQDLSFGAYILSLTGRVAGCRGPRLSCNAVAEAWFFRSWAVVLRSYRLTRARDCRSTRSTPSGPCSELLAMSPLPLTPSFTLDLRYSSPPQHEAVYGVRRSGSALPPAGGPMRNCSTHAARPARTNLGPIEVTSASPAISSRKDADRIQEPMVEPQGRRAG